MIQITDKSKCCGCEACVQACPRKCIVFTQDKEGFYYPQVDKEQCIDCGLCEQACPELSVYDKHLPIEVLAAINKNDEVRSSSSSGGVFSVLAEKVIDSGGVVFGVRFDDDWLAVFDYAESMEQVAAFRGSKYLQARVGDSFSHCKRFLNEGRQVLFSGTPCQIAALNHFLRKPYPNLLTVDFVCHGVPSPKVWQHYLKEVVKAGRKAILDVKFRDKKHGWKQFGFVLDYHDGTKAYTMSSPFRENQYMKSFLANLILRPSCHACPAKEGRSHSDVTIADFWGVDKVSPLMDDDKGTSLVLIHTGKGASAFSREALRIANVAFEEACRYNSAYVHSVSKHPNRDKFFATFDESTDLHRMIRECFRPPLNQRVKQIMKLPFRMAKHAVFWIVNKCERRGGKTTDISHY